MNFEQRAKELVSKMTLEEKMSQLCNEAPAIERLGIPAYDWWSECLHGVARAGTATVFPQPIGMAATFNEELVKEVGDTISTEARAKYNEYKKFGGTQIYHGLTECAPNINIFRDPRWGRGQETFGEDPCLTGRMGAAFVNGLQGNGKSKYRKVDTTLKHFAVHSGPESLRHGFNAVVGEKDLRETYLWAFKYCIDNADAAAVMGAYNAVNGEPATGGPRLVKEILYGEWGFKGYMVSDAGSVRDIHENHKFTKDEAESAAYALNNGCQLNIGQSYEQLPEAYRRGLVSEKTISEACEKLFATRFRLGMFDDDCEYDAISYDVVECEKHRMLNRKIAEESIVLLKNDGILPLNKQKNIAVIGPNADDISILLGNYNGFPSRYTTLLRGIQEVSDANIIYSRGSSPFGDLSIHREPPIKEAIIAAQKADVVILCVGLNPSMEGEEGDASRSANCGDREDIEIPAAQKTLIEKVIAVGKPTVLVNVSGSCVNLDYADKNCNAVIQYFYPGAEGGMALANVLFGETSPAGRLPVTFYRSVDDLPPFEDYSMENRTYKFFKGKAVYEFGHGLTYSEITEEWKDENTVEVFNKGAYDTAYSVLKYEYVPHKSLCDFKKIFIKSGEKITVNFKK
ncbi:MAG: glycoside hydrolase family 3 protein [Ruminococcaceae bacterium]|nr:glycoside hydrolase family 3 protein [Oscillospiraceae bacterium]